MAKFDYVTLYDFMGNFMDSNNELEKYAIPDSILYDFVKEKTDDFDPYKFKLFMGDVRGFIYNLDHYLINDRAIQAKEPSNSHIPGLDELFSGLNPMYEVKFGDDESLRERVNTLLKNDICIMDRYGYSSLFHFSDIAEEIYRIKITEYADTHVANNNIYTVLNTPPDPAHFRFDSDLSEKNLIAVKSYFIRKNMLADTTDENWLYWFKKSDCDNPSILNWTTSPTMLVNCFSLISNNSYRKAIKSAFGISVPSPTLKNFERTGTHFDLTRILAE